MVVLLGFIALAVDVGMVTFSKAKLQNAADAAALAGAQELPENTEKGKQVAEEYIEENYEGVICTVSFEGEKSEVIKVNVKNRVDFLFARVFAYDSKEVSAEAKAMNAPAKNVIDGLRPFGVVWNEGDPKYTVGSTYVLKYSIRKGKDGDGIDVGPGNFGAIKINRKSDGKFESGASVYKETIIKGSKSKLSIGDIIYSETGNMVGPTEEGINTFVSNLEEDEKPIVIIPLVDTLDINGTKPITITGFAAFEIENIETSKEDKVEKAEVTAKFIRFITVGEGDLGIANNGLKVVNLVE